MAVRLTNTDLLCFYCFPHNVCCYITVFLTQPEAKVQNRSRRGINSCNPVNISGHLTPVQELCYPVHISYHATQVFHSAVKEAYTENVLEHFVSRRKLVHIMKSF